MIDKLLNKLIDSTMALHYFQLDQLVLVVQIYIADHNQVSIIVHMTAVFSSLLMQQVIIKLHLDKHVDISVINQVKVFSYQLVQFYVQT